MKPRSRPEPEAQLQSRLETEHTGKSEAGVGPTTPWEGVSSNIQNRFGNQQFIDALETPVSDPLSSVLATTAAMAVGGVDGPTLSSNTAMVEAIASTAGLEQSPVPGETFDATPAMDQTGLQSSLPPAIAHRIEDGAPAIQRKARRSSSAQALVPSSSGKALPADQRARFEAAMGHRFDHVRVHTDTPAAQAADALQAHAFTVGSDIYFGRGEFSPGTDSGDRLLAHELTHVVQHDQGRLAGQEGVSSPGDAHEREAEAAESRIVDELNTMELGIVSSVYEAVGELGLAEFGESSETGPSSDDGPVLRSTDEEEDDDSLFISLVRQFAPTLATIIDEGFAVAFQEELEAGLSAWVDSLLEEVDLGTLVEGLLSDLASVVELVTGAAAGDEDCCSALTGWVDALTALGEQWIAESPIATIFSETSASFAEVLGPIGEMLQGKLDAFSEWLSPYLEGAADLVQSGIDAVSAVNQSAGEWLAGKLGVENPEGGLLELVIAQAAEGLSALMAGVQTCIDAALEFWFSIPGTEEVYRFVDLALEIIDGVVWLKEHWGEDNLLELSHEEMGQTWVPGFVEMVDKVRAQYDELVAWLGSTAALAAELTVQMVDGLLGVPVLSGLVGFVQATGDAIGWLLDSPMWADIGSALGVAWDYASTVLVAFGEVLLALGTVAWNPLAIPGIVTMGALALLPDCLVAAVYDLLITWAIAGIENVILPALIAVAPALEPFIGNLHPALVGTLEGARALSNEEKSQVFMRLAALASGASLVEFIGGVVFGIVEGVIDELIGIFELLMFCAQLVPNLLTWMLELGAWLAIMFPIWVGEAIARTWDAAGDRHFKEDAYAPATDVPTSGGIDAQGNVWTDPNPAPQSATTTAPDTGEVDAMAQAAAGEVQAGSEGMGSAEEQVRSEAGQVSDSGGLASFIGSLFDLLAAGVEAVTAELAEGIMRAMLWLGEHPFTAGRWLGYVVGVIGFEALLTKGLGLVTKAVPALKGAAEVVIGIVKMVEDIQAEVFFSAMRGLGKAFSGFADSAASLLRSLDIPVLNKLIEAIEGTARKFKEFIEEVVEWVQSKLGRHADDVEVPEAAEKAAVAAQAGAVVGAMDATGASLITVLATLKGLQTMYPWIRAFKAEPGARFEWDIYLIASRLPVWMNLDVLPDGTELKRRRTSGEILDALHYVREAGEGLDDEAVSILMELADDIGRFAKANPGADLSADLAGQLDYILSALEPRIIDNNPILSEAWARAVDRLAELPRFEDCFDDAGNLLPDVSAKKMKAMYAEARSEFSKAFDTVITDLAAEYSELSGLLDSFPKGVHLHHILYKAKFPDEAINPRNLMLALGGKGELHSLVHLLMKGGLVSPGNRWTTMLPQLEAAVREAYDL